MSQPAVQIDFSIVTDQMVFSADGSNGSSDVFTSADQLYDSGDDITDNNGKEALPNMDVNNR